MIVAKFETVDKGWYSNFFCSHSEWGWACLFFKVSSGFKQGDPLSPPTIYCVMEVLNKILLRARELELFKILKVNEGELIEEVTHLFFADDTLLLRKVDYG